MCEYTDQEFIEAVKSSLSNAEVCKKIGIKAVGGNYQTVKNKIKKLDLDCSHFTGQAWNQGKRYRMIKPAKSLTEILQKDTPYQSYRLAKRLIKEGLKESKCECCGLTEWLNQPIKLELHHINGDHNDNRLENLQMLCPNCHAYTDNYRGKNQERSAQNENSEVESRKFEEPLIGNANGNLEPSPKNYIFLEEGVETIHEKSNSSKKPKEPKYCLYCGIELIGSARRNKYCSSECAHKANGSKRPPVQELIDKFKELKSFVQVGKFYKVSDNAVRKWVKFYQIEDMIKK
jgi:hypothetical protein